MTTDRFFQIGQIRQLARCLLELSHRELQLDPCEELTLTPNFHTINEQGSVREDFVETSTISQVILIIVSSKFAYTKKMR